jgi:hypothetical protein
VALSGVFSDARMRDSVVGREILHTVFGRREHYYDAFPLYHVSDTSPPLLLMNGKSDLSLRAHTMDLHFAARQKQVYSKVVYTDRSHFGICKDWDGTNRETLQTIVTFLREVLHCADCAQ